MGGGDTALYGEMVGRGRFTALGIGCNNYYYINKLANITNLSCIISTKQVKEISYSTETRHIK